MQAHMRGAAPKELIALLKSIEEATVADGRPRYNEEVGVNGLRRLVMGHNKYKTLLNLAHLVAAVEYCHAGGASRFFFSQQPLSSRGAIRQAVSEVYGRRPESRYSVHRGGLVCRYGEGEKNNWTVWWSKQNKDVLILPPLFELLYYVHLYSGEEDFQALEKDFQALAGDGIKRDDVGKTAGKWENAINRWLRKLTGAHDKDDPWVPATEQRVRHFSYMFRWFRASTKMGNPPGADRSLLELLTDVQVLAFWRAHWPDATVIEGADAGNEADGPTDRQPRPSERYRTFELVAELAMHLWQSTEEGLRQLSPDVCMMVCADETDSVSEDTIVAADVGAVNASADLLPTLRSSPVSEIKWLKGGEMDIVERIAEAGSAGRHLPLTLLRAETFGRHQRRMGKAIARRDLLADLLSCESATTYGEWVANTGRIRERIAVMRHCCLHVLVHLRSPSAIERIRNALPNLSCWNTVDAAIAAADPETGSGDDEHLETAGSIFFRDLKKLRLREPKLNEHLRRVAQSFEKVNTQGFTELPGEGTQIGEMEVADVYQLGDETLADLDTVTKSYLDTLPSDRSRLHEQFRSDLCTFREGFARIYAPGGAT